ncbi:hypothetical protein V8G54_004611 [Vigna mungo]|uniref:Uncharacterized protein n=1 Tax=Vigna mungo TaxID=3915 RepID=A0AAQ3PE54_VIGMU
MGDLPGSFPGKCASDDKAHWKALCPYKLPGSYRWYQSLASPSTVWFDDEPSGSWWAWRGVIAGAKRMDKERLLAGFEWKGHMDESNIHRNERDLETPGVIMGWVTFREVFPENVRVMTKHTGKPCGDVWYQSLAFPSTVWFEDEPSGSWWACDARALTRAGSDRFEWKGHMDESNIHRNERDLEGSFPGKCASDDKAHWKALCPYKLPGRYRWYQSLASPSTVWFEDEPSGSWWAWRGVIASNIHRNERDLETPGVIMGWVTFREVFPESVRVMTKNTGKPCGDVWGQSTMNHHESSPMSKTNNLDSNTLPLQTQGQNETTTNPQATTKEGTPIRQARATTLLPTEKTNIQTINNNNRKEKKTKKTKNTHSEAEVDKGSWWFFFKGCWVITFLRGLSLLFFEEDVKGVLLLFVNMQKERNPYLQLTANTTKNRGKHFSGCFKYKNGVQGDGCNFFKWCIDVGNEDSGRYVKIEGNKETLVSSEELEMDKETTMAYISSRFAIGNKLCQLESIQVLPNTRNLECISHKKERVIWLKSQKVESVNE